MVVRKLEQISEFILLSLKKQSTRIKQDRILHKIHKLLYKHLAIIVHINVIYIQINKLK